MTDLNEAQEAQPVETPDEPSLDEVLDYEEAETVDEPEAESPDAEPEPEKAEEPEKPAADKSPPEESTSDSKDEEWKKYAWLDERKKRQELEAKLEELTKGEEHEPTSVLEDEDKAFRERLGKLEVQYLQREFERSKRHAIKDHGDELVSQAVDWFNQAAPNTPALLQRFHESMNDVSEVVEMYQQNQEMTQLKDVGTIKEKLRAEIMEELKAEFSEKQGQQQKETASKRKSITPSLAAQSSQKESDRPSDDDLGAVTLGD